MHDTQHFAYQSSKNNLIRFISIVFEAIQFSLLVHFAGQLYYLLLDEETDMNKISFNIFIVLPSFSILIHNTISKFVVFSIINFISLPSTILTR